LGPAQCGGLQPFAKRLQAIQDRWCAARHLIGGLKTPPTQMAIPLQMDENSKNSWSLQTGVL
jgi:hypothetical protein